MPDLDIVERRIKSHWRGPYRLIKGGQPIELVAGTALKAATAQIRIDGGVLGFSELALVLQPASTSNSSMAAVTREVERQFGQSQAVKILGRAFLRQQALVAEGKMLPSPQALASDYCWELIQHHLLGRVEPTLVGKGCRFENLDALRSYKNKVRSIIEPDLKRLATRITTNPENRRIRAPARQRHRSSVETLLSKPIF